MQVTTEHDREGERPPLLIDRARALRTDIAGVKKLEETSKYAELFRTRADALQGPLDELEGLVIILGEFRRRGISVALEHGVASALKQHAVQLAERYRDAPESITASAPELRFGFWQALERLPETLEAALRAAWVAHVDGALPATHDATLKALERVPGFGAQVAEIRRLYRAAAVLKEAIPADESALERAAEIGAGLRTAWRDLHGEGLPEGVREFLAEANDWRATLAHLTPTVVAWLEVNGLADLVRISLGAAAPSTAAQSPAPTPTETRPPSRWSGASYGRF